MSNQSLVLRGLTRQRSGHYKCVGVNARGEGSSNLVLLTVRYTPVCRYPVTNIRGAERGEFLNLSCSVDALPRPLKYKYIYYLACSCFRDRLAWTQPSSNEFASPAPCARVCWSRTVAQRLSMSVYNLRFFHHSSFNVVINLSTLRRWWKFHQTRGKL